MSPHEYWTCHVILHFLGNCIKEHGSTILTPRGAVLVQTLIICTHVVRGMWETIPSPAEDSALRQACQLFYRRDSHHRLPLSSCHPSCSDSCPTLAGLFPACRRFPVKKMTSKRKLKRKRNDRKRLDKCLRGADSFELKIKLTRV